MPSAGSGPTGPSCHVVLRKPRREAGAMAQQPLPAVVPCLWGASFHRMSAGWAPEWSLEGSPLWFGARIHTPAECEPCRGGRVSAEWAAEGCCLALFSPLPPWRGAAHRGETGGGLRACPERVQRWPVEARARGRRELEHSTNAAREPQRVPSKPVGSSQETEDPA